MLRDLIMAGGPGMFAILSIGAVALGTAGWFAWRAEGRVRGFLDSIARALLYASLTSLSVDLMHVFVFAMGRPQEEWGRVLIEGFSESLAPLVMGFPMLALVHLLIAIGQRRLDGRRA
jgi:hypothetical protein